MVLVYIMLGLLAGFLSGLLGIGGGIFLVPSFAALFTYLNFQDGAILRCAIGTSLATMTFTALFSILSHAKHTKIEWKIVKWLALGMVVGAIFGTWLVDKLPVVVIKAFFSVLCLYVSIRLFRRKFIISENTVYRKINLPTFIFIGFLVGCASGMLGIGGGLLLVPLLLWFGMSFAKASASSIACTFPTVLAGAMGASLMGLDAVNLPPNSFGFVVWPVALVTGFGALIGAPLGVKSLHYFPEHWVKKLFSLILIIIAWQMFPRIW
jgi:uncharacterized membrane protein YfcA